MLNRCLSWNFALLLHCSILIQNPVCLSDEVRQLNGYLKIPVLIPNLSQYPPPSATSQSVVNDSMSWYVHVITCFQQAVMSNNSNWLPARLIFNKIKSSMLCFAVTNSNSSKYCWTRISFYLEVHGMPVWIFAQHELRMHCPGTLPSPGVNNSGHMTILNKRLSHWLAISHICYQHEHRSRLKLLHWYNPRVTWVSFSPDWILVWNHLHWFDFKRQQWCLGENNHITVRRFKAGALK